MPGVYIGDAVNRVRQVMEDVIKDAIGKDGVQLAEINDYSAMDHRFLLVVKRYNRVFEINASITHDMFVGNPLQDVVAMVTDGMIREMQQAFQDHLKSMGLR